MKTLKRKRGTATDAAAAAAPVVVVPSSCTVKDAAQFKTELCTCVDSADRVIVDIANIERIDTAALQLLCAFVRDRRARGLKVVWRGSSAPFLEAAELLDMHVLLGLGDVDTGAAA
jgi:anti-anti-sigma regulatory factor